MAEENSDLPSLLNHAKSQEREYSWATASGTYARILESHPTLGPLQRGEIEEARAHASFRFAFQADTNEEFRERLNTAISQYSKARDRYIGIEGRESLPYQRRCDSMIAFLNYWLTSELAERKKTTNDSWRLAKESLAAFDKAGDKHNYVRTFNLLSSSAGLAYSYGEDFKAREEIVRSVMECGQLAVESLSTTLESGELAATYANASVPLEEYAWLCEWKDVPKYHKRALEYWKRASDISQEIAAANLMAFLMGTAPPNPPGIEIGTEEYMGLLLKGFEHAKKTRDVLARCGVLSCLAAEWNWRQLRAQDSDELEYNFNQALQYSQASQKESSILSFRVPYVDGEIWTEVPYAGLYGIRAYFGFDFLRIREFAEKAVAASQDLMRLAEESGYPMVQRAAHHECGYYLTTLARTESDPEKKEKLLKDALEHREKSKATISRFSPRGGWGLGAELNLLAETKLELASITVNVEAKRAMLHEAVALRKEGLEESLKAMSVYETFEPWRYRLLGRWVSDYGITLERLYEVEGDQSIMKAAAETYEKAADMYKKSGHPSRAAESYWKAARAYDSTGDFTKAVDRFESAAVHYRQSAETIPQLAALLHDHSIYMQAWAEIERARHYHTRQDASAARECYEKASALHKSTEGWKFLAPNYMAWAEVERGEDLSRKEKSKESIAAFERAAKLFVETKESLTSELAKIDTLDEKENVTRLVKAADLRREYCLGRMSLEEAKVLDKEGDEFGSCEKFGSAAETFQRIQCNLESDQDRREIQLITTLSKAWQTMARAEGEASPELYEDASKLFETAKELSVGERAKLLAMGHSRFCKALEAGVRFSETGDSSLHTVATQNLENAAKHYLKAGLVNDSEYAKASKLLFDAYVYMDKASREEDQAKKAKLYAMTEKVLETSAASYSRAEYPKRRDQVLRLLDKVKAERELAVTLTEVLHAPDLISSTAALVTPTPSHEKAVGLQRFERAHVEAKVIARPVEINVGEDVTIDIELVNAGGGPAQLTMVENVVPRGFDVVSKLEKYRIEDSNIDLKGKKLDPLTAEAVSLVIKSGAKGNFSFAPRILYVDETGDSKFVESKQITLTVRELGVAGWLKGPEKKR